MLSLAEHAKDNEFNEKGEDIVTKMKELVRKTLDSAPSYRIQTYIDELKALDLTVKKWNMDKKEKSAKVTEHLEKIRSFQLSVPTHIAIRHLEHNNPPDTEFTWNRFVYKPDLKNWLTKEDDNKVMFLSSTYSKFQALSIEQLAKEDMAILYNSMNLWIKFIEETKQKIDDYFDKFKAKSQESTLQSSGP